MRATAPSSQRSIERSLPAARRGGRAARGAALWATLSFAGAAVLCQAVGLTSVVAGILHGAETLPDRHRVYTGDPIQTGSLPAIYRVDQARCTSLELDRRTNGIVAGRCPDDGLTLRLEGESDREDLPLVAGNEPR